MSSMQPDPWATLARLYGLQNQPARTLVLLAFIGVSFTLLPLSAAAGDGDNDSTLSALTGSLATDNLSTAALELSGAVIGSIVIENGNVFNTDIAAENKVLYRTANAIHKRTRQQVIEQQLLFHSGEPYSGRLLEESERILRSDPYLQEARIQPVRNSDGEVDVVVTTRDAWTLRPSVAFGRSGGENSGGIGFDELNLFGTGIRVGLKYRSDVDRDSLSFQFLDNNLGSSWTQLQATHANNSDGFSRGLRVEQPFHALDSRRAYGLTLGQNERIDSLYDRGLTQRQYQGRSTEFDLYTGWSKGVADGWARRYLVGVAGDEHQFAGIADEPGPSPLVPDNRRFVYPYVGIEFVQDKFEKARNLEQINRTEDRNLGTTFSARVGFASEGFGSDRDALLVRTAIGRGFGNTSSRSLMLEAGVDGRWESAGLRDLTANFSARYFRRHSEGSLFYASLSGRIGQNVDLDNLIPLGGDTGLRGYPLRYQMGESRALLTIEQRYFTDWYPFRLFHVGAAVFADIGRSWGNNPVAGANPGLLRDVGFGLRLGSTRAAQGRVVHIDLAYPLDGDNSISNVQFLVGTKRSF